MARRTKKVGVSGRFGPRYGVRTRKQIASVIRSKGKKYECPRCKHKAVRRVSTGIWRCRRCDLTFAGGAYSPTLSATPYHPGGGKESEVVVLNDDATPEEEA